MRTALTCLSSLLLLAPAATQANRRPPPREARTDKPQEGPPALRSGPGQDQGREAPRPPEQRGPNDERDPERRRRFEQRRADAVEARQLGRTLIELGRQSRSPLALIAAAEVLQRLPPARELTTAQTETEEGPTIPPRDATSPIPPRDATSQGLASRPPLGPSARPQRPGAKPPMLMQTSDVLEEARALAKARPATQQRELLALLDNLEASEVTTRGAALGPQSTCEGISPQTKLTYHIAYDGGERAALGISGAGPGDLFINISDEEGNLVSRTWDRSLISWYPRWRGVFRVDIESRSVQRIEFCLETN